MTGLARDWLEPAELLDGILKEQKRLISGYIGSPSTTDLERLKEAKKPAHVAVSLMGEPTLYPMLAELIEEIKSRGMTAFLVSNGTRPQVISEVKPTQLYISLNAPDEEAYKLMSGSRTNHWSEFLESLDVVKSSPFRTVIRLTLMRNLNMRNLEGYANLLKRAEPDFVEVKAYMHLGSSRERLTRDRMPSHLEVMDFADELSDMLGYELVSEVPLSRVALLSKGSKPEKIDL